MGWESRGDGHYYYRKVRYGNRVVSEYIGTGQVAEIVAQLAEGAREEAARHREADRQAIQQAEAADADLARLSDLLRRQATEALEHAGFHRHKWQWRRRRNGRAQHGH